MSETPQRKVYKITNKANGKVYIGVTETDVDYRVRNHIYALRKNRHHSRLMQNDFNLYGEESFESSVIEYVENSIHQYERERYYIELYESYNPDKGYNFNFKNSDAIIEKDSRGKDNITREEYEALEKRLKLLEDYVEYISGIVRGDPKPL